VIRDATTHELVRKVNFGFTTSLTVMDLEAVPLADGSQHLAVAAERGDGTVIVITKRAADGALISRVRARGLATVTDLGLLLGDGSAPVLGVLGDRGDGNSVIVLVDPATRNVLRPSPFPAGADARELSMAPGLIGSLGSGTGTKLRITLRYCADGTSAGSLLVP